VDPLTYILHLITNLSNLSGLIQAYGPWVYGVLFLIIFCETGLVVFPFLPGDSILFIAGTFAAGGSLDVYMLISILAVAAVAGDSVNYGIGRYVGPRAFKGNIRYLKKEYLDRAHSFFEKYGGKAIVIGRFAPVIRTFVPFVAGIGSMRYRRFFTFNVLGGVAWILLLVLGGYALGNVPFVKDNFTTVVYAIIIISLLPAAYEFLHQRHYGRLRSV
jgi:membrane-associated protein